MGYTQVSEDGNIGIYLDINQPYFAMLETISHEMAHAIVGIEHEHDEVWENKFDEIYNEYIRLCNEKYGEECEQLNCNLGFIDESK